MKKRIAMDIGGCCADLKPERCFSDLKLDNINPQFYPKALDFAAKDFETGKIDRDEFAHRFIQAYNLSGFSIRDVQNAWEKFLGDPMPGMEQVFQDVHAAGNEIILFSDTSELHVEALMRTMPFLNTADGAVYSHIVGWRKPDFHMFQAFEQQYGRPALYVDDRVNNQQAGREFGWSVHPFTSISVLREDLKKQGLIL